MTDFIVSLIPKTWLENTKNQIEKINDGIDYIIKPVYYFLIYFIYLSYVAILLGTYFINPDYIHVASQILQFLVCIFLIIRFNPLRKAGLTVFDQKLIFVSGIILLTNVGITGYFLSILDKYTPAAFLIDKFDSSKKNTPSHGATTTNLGGFDFTNKNPLGDTTVYPENKPLY